MISWISIAALDDRLPASVALMLRSRRPEGRLGLTPTRRQPILLVAKGVGDVPRPSDSTPRRAGRSLPDLGLTRAHEPDYARRRLIGQRVLGMRTPTGGASPAKRVKRTPASLSFRVRTHTFRSLLSLARRSAIILPSTGHRTVLRFVHARRRAVLHAYLGQRISFRSDHLWRAVSLRAHGSGSGTRQQVHGIEACGPSQEPPRNRMATAPQLPSGQTRLHLEASEGGRLRRWLLLARPHLSAGETARDERRRLAHQDRPEPAKGPPQRARSALPGVEGPSGMGVSTEEGPRTSSTAGTSCCRIEETTRYTCLAAGGAATSPGPRPFGDVGRRAAAGLRSRRPQVRILSGAPTSQGPFPKEKGLFRWVFRLVRLLGSPLPIGSEMARNRRKTPGRSTKS